MIFTADSHIWSREKDDFHKVLPDLWNFRLRGNPDEPWCHVGDTLDLLYEPNIFKIYADYKEWLDYCWRQGDVWIIGNHDFQLKELGKVYPQRFMGQFQIGDYKILHGHTFDWSSDEEGDSIAGLHAALIYQRFSWVPGAKVIKEWVDGFHHKSEPFLKKFDDLGWDKVIFGHCHCPGVWGTIGNCGCVATDRTLIRLVGDELCLIKF
jgi:predicted phosphodiesterase